MAVENILKINIVDSDINIIYAYLHLKLMCPQKRKYIYHHLPSKLTFILRFYFLLIYFFMASVWNHFDCI